MANTKQSQSGNIQTGGTIPPEPSPTPPEQPSGSFVIADLPATPPPETTPSSQGSDISPPLPPPVTSGPMSPPQMTVESIPDLPAPPQPETAPFSQGSDNSPPLPPPVTSGPMSPPQMTVESIPDLPVTSPSQGVNDSLTNMSPPTSEIPGNNSPSTVSPPPQMKVEPILDMPEPIPSSSYTPNVEIPLPPPNQTAGNTSNTAQTNSFMPQGLMSEQPPASPPFVSPPISVPSRSNPLKWIFLLLIIVLLGLGAFLGIRLGGQAINNNKEVTLTYWGLWENDAIVRPIIEAFEAENPKIKVSYVAQNHKEYRQRLEAAINRGDGPDLFRYHATWIPMLRNQIEPVPGEVMPAAEFSSKYYPVIVNDLLAGSTLWGIPFMIDGLGLYINEDLFASAGVFPPKTYEELLSIVPRLTVKDGDTIVTSAIALGTTNNIDHFSDILGLMIMQNGGSLAQPIGEEAEQALIFYRKFSTPSDPQYTWNELQDNAVSAFANGRLAMMIAPSWRAFDIRKINPTINFRIEPVPQLPGKPLTWASYWVEGVSSQSNNKEQAFTFLKYLTSEETVKRLYSEAVKTRLFGPPYALKNIGTQLESDPFVGAYIQQAEYARSFPLASKTHDNGLNDQMIGYMEDAINSTIQGNAPSEALNTMSQGFQQVLSRFGLATSRSTQ